MDYLTMYLVNDFMAFDYERCKSIVDCNSCDMALVCTQHAIEQGYL